MASSAAQSKKQFKRSMTKKSHSWWWDSHNCPKNSKWLAENLEKMDDRVNHMLKLIEEDADSFAKKAQMYYQKRPELIHLVEEFYRMYRALAERYDQASGELQKKLPSDQSSPSRPHKEDEESSSLTDSGSDSGSVPDDEEALIRRLADLELELQETNQKLLLQQETVSGDKIRVNEGQVREADEKMARQEEEMANLKIELQGCMSSEKKTCSLDKEETGDARKVQALEEELSIAKEKLQEFEEEMCFLKNELKISKAAEVKLEKDSDSHINAEKKEVLKLHERLAMVEIRLQDRDNEIRVLKTAVSDTEEKIFPEKAQMKGEMSKLGELESNIRLIREEKAETEKKVSVMRDERDALKEENGKIKEMEKHMEELHMEQVRLRRRSGELGEEVEKTRVAASEVAEQKREAIRQLCVSLDYYRDGYERLWKVVAAGLYKRGVVIHS